MASESSTPSPSPPPPSDSPRSTHSSPHPPPPPTLSPPPPAPPAANSPSNSTTSPPANPPKESPPSTAKTSKASKIPPPPPPPLSPPPPTPPAKSPSNFTTFLPDDPRKESPPSSAKKSSTTTSKASKIPPPPPPPLSPPTPALPSADSPSNSATSPPDDSPKESRPSSARKSSTTSNKASKIPPPPPESEPPDHDSPPPPAKQSGNSPTKKHNTNKSPPPPSSEATPSSTMTPAPTPESTPSEPTQKSSPPPQGTSPGPPAIEQSPPSDVPSDTQGTKSSTDGESKRSHSENEGGLSTGALVALGVVFGLILIGILGTAAFFLYKRKKRVLRHQGVYPMQANATHGSGSPHDPNSFGKTKSFFSYEELSESTGGFSSQNLLGEGGFGSVYKGKLCDGRDVAIKKLKIGGQQGDREFRAEVEIITRIHHRNLVSLVGYCIYENRRLLVYEYVPNSTLYFHLHGKGTPILGWAARVKISIGAARGIAYLHEDCHPRIIHRDIKSSNILLDKNFEARVSDFGLAKLAVDVYTHVTTRVMGTFGYLAPEYASTGKLTEKSDVYSFGVVLLEMITGRKPVDSSLPEEDAGLVEWARPLVSEALETNDFGAVADPSLEGHYAVSEMFKMVEVAAACVRHAHTMRPKMGQVARALDDMFNSDLTNGIKVGEREMFDGKQQTAEYKLLKKMAFENQDFSTKFFNQSGTGSDRNQQSSQKESSSPGRSEPS